MSTNMAFSLLSSARGYTNFRRNLFGRSGAKNVRRNVVISQQRGFASITDEKGNEYYQIKHTPTQIKLKKKEKILEVVFDNGQSFRYPAEYLRIESPSAEVQGHGGPETKRLIVGRRFVGIVEIEAVGNYAIRLVFDDLHETGIYSWDYLYHLGENKRKLMREYIKRLKAAGKSRDPRLNPSPVQQQHKHVT